MSELQPAETDTRDTELRQGRLGVFGIVFFVVAAAAPLVGMTGAVPVAIVLGNGAAAPGAYVAVGLVLLLFSVGYNAMSRHVTNTGAFFAYVGRSLGIAVGVGSAFVSQVAYLAILLAIFGFFGALSSSQMTTQFGIGWSWWVWTLIAWMVVSILSVLSIDIGARFLGVLMGLELLSLVVTALAVLVQGGGPEGFDLFASFAPNKIFAGGLGGASGIALAFAFASYIGFEATAIYGEEAKDPHRTVPRATYIAVAVIALVFGLTSFAIVSGLGPSTVVERVLTISGGLEDPAAVLFAVATEYVGAWMATLMGWLLLSSLLAGLLAFQNSSARYLFAMGRAGVLPRKLGRVNAAGAPATASITTSVVTLAVISLFILNDLDPVTHMFFWFSGLAVVAIVWVEILVCLAVVVYFHGNDEDDRIWNTIVAPVSAFVLLALGQYLLTSRFGLLAGTVAEGVDPAAQAWGLNPLGWFLIGLPSILFVAGSIVGALRRNVENEDAIADLVT